jgi:hypothetical protein
LPADLVRGIAGQKSNFFDVGLRDSSGDLKELNID